MLEQLLQKQVANSTMADSYERPRRVEGLTDFALTA